MAVASLGTLPPWWTYRADLGGGAHSVEAATGARLASYVAGAAFGACGQATTLGFGPSP